MNEYESPLAAKEHSRRPQVLALFAGGLFYVFTRMKRMPPKILELSNKAWLEGQSIGQKKSDITIASELGCSRRTVGGWRRKHGISLYRIPELHDKAWLEEHYLKQGKYDQAIADELGCAVATVTKWRRIQGVRRRATRIRRVCAQCGVVVLKSPSVVARNVHFFCDKDCKCVWQSKHRVGENAANWKGGPTGERKTWMQNGGRQFNTACRKRDDYTCQRCGRVFDKRSNGLSVHHKASFLEYPGLRSEEANGITLCRKCHYHIHSNEGLLLRLRWKQDALFELAGYLNTEWNEVAGCSS